MASDRGWCCRVGAAASQEAALLWSSWSELAIRREPTVDEVFELFDREANASPDVDRGELFGPDELVDGASTHREHLSRLRNGDEEGAPHDCRFVIAFSIRIDRRQLSSVIARSHGRLVDLDDQ